MRYLPVHLLALAASTVLSASETGPFAPTPRVYNPASPTPDMIAADGTIEAATLVSGGSDAGRIQLESWAGQTLTGGYGFGGNTLRGPSGTNYFVGLSKDWAIREGVESGDGYFYYHRFQQDLRWYAGWADVSNGPLPDRFHIDQTASMNRLVVSVPLRWVLGGGSSFQTGSYGGNPPQAVVLWVPAGLSVMQAESNPENRLGKISNVFSEFQPHQHQWQVKLQPGGESGTWELRIDIDADGVVDVDVTSEQEGNRRAPGVMREDSGLIVTTTNSSGHPAGTIGRTSMELLYRQSQTEAIASPLNRRPLKVEIPESSRISPVRIEAKRWSPAWAISATSQGNVLPGSSISDRFFVDLPLNKANIDGTQIAVTQTGGMTATGAVIWEPTNIYNTESMTVLRGSSILVTYDGNCGKEDIEIACDDGSQITYFQGESGDSTEIAFTKSGEYIITARAEGKYAGALTVRVIDIQFPKRIVSQVGYERPVVVQTSTYANDDIVFTGTKDVLGVAVADKSGKNIALRVRPISITGANPVIYARLGSANGPIIGTAEVTPFTIERSSKGALVALSLRDNPISEAKVTLKMHPYIPDLVIKFDMLGGNATFKDGLKTWYLSSNALSSPDGFEYVIQIPKASSRNRATCHNLYFAETRTTASDFSTPYAAQASRGDASSSESNIDSDDFADLLYVSGSNPENDDAVSADLPCCPEVVAGSVTTKVSIFEYGDHKQEYTLKFGKDSGGEEPDPTWDSFTNKTTNDVFTDHPMSGNGIQTNVTAAMYSLSLGDQKDSAKVGLIHRELLELEAWDSTNAANKESSKQATPPEVPLYVLGKQVPNGATQATILIKMKGITAGMEKCVLWRIDEAEAVAPSGSFQGQGDGISIDLKTQLKGNHTYIVRAGVDTNENGELSDSEVSKALRVKVIEVIFDPAFIEIFQGKDIGETTAYIYPADDDVWPKVSFQTTDKKLTVLPANATAAVVPLVIKSTHKGNQELKASLISLVQTKSGTGESGKAQIVVRPLPDYSIAAPKTKTICLGSTHNEFVTLTGDEHADQKVQITVEKDPAMPNPVGILFANGAAQSPWIDLPKKAVVQVPITITSPAGGKISPDGTTRFTFKASNDSNPARKKSAATTIFLFNVTGLKTSRPLLFKFNQGQNVQLDLVYEGKLGPDVTIDYVLYDIELAKEAWRKPSSRPSSSGPIPGPGRYIGIAYYCNGKRVSSPSFTAFTATFKSDLVYNWDNYESFDPIFKTADELKSDMLESADRALKFKDAMLVFADRASAQLEVAVKALDKSVKKCDAQITVLDNQIKAKKASQSVAESTIGRLAPQLEDAIKQKEKIELRLRELEGLLSPSERVRELIASLRQDLSRVNAKITDLASEISELRIKILSWAEEILEIGAAKSEVQATKTVLLETKASAVATFQAKAVRMYPGMLQLQTVLAAAESKSAQLAIKVAKFGIFEALPIVGIGVDMYQWYHFDDARDKLQEELQNLDEIRARFQKEIDSLKAERNPAPLTLKAELVTVPGGIWFKLSESNISFKTRDSIAGSEAEGEWDWEHFVLPDGKVTAYESELYRTSPGVSGGWTMDFFAYGNLGRSRVTAQGLNGSESTVEMDSFIARSDSSDRTEQEMVKLAEAKDREYTAAIKELHRQVEVVSTAASIVLSIAGIALVAIGSALAPVIVVAAAVVAVLKLVWDFFLKDWLESDFVKSIRHLYPKSP